MSDEMNGNINIGNWDTRIIGTNHEFGIIGTNKVICVFGSNNDVIYAKYTHREVFSWIYH